MLLHDYRQQYKQTLRLAAPVVLSQVGQVTVQLFDNAMVGRLGALPLAATSFGGTVFFMVFVLVMGISMGLTPLVGEQYSKGKYRKAAVFFQNSLILYSAIGFIAMIAAFALIPLMFHMNQPPEVVEMAIPYYRYLALSIVPFMVFASYKQFLEGLGNTTANMVIIITANMINIFLNWLLIYGNWGFPVMGAAGAGLATMISRVCMPVFAVIYFAFVPKLKRYYKYFKRENLRWRWNRSLLAMGFPISMQMFMEGTAFALTSIMMGWIGTAEIAANQIALTISNFAFMVVMGIGAATTIRVSHEYGRGNLTAMRKAGMASFHICLVWNAFTALMFIVFRNHIPLLFNDDPQVVSIAAFLLFFTAAFQFSDGIQHISIGILRGMQDVKSIMIIAFISYVLINIPVGYICAFVFDMGAAGLWIGLIVGLSVAALLLILRFRSIYSSIRKARFITARN